MSASARQAARRRLMPCTARPNAAEAARGTSATNSGALTGGDGAAGASAAATGVPGAGTSGGEDTAVSGIGSSSTAVGTTGSDVVEVRHRFRRRRLCRCRRHDRRARQLRLRGRNRGSLRGWRLGMLDLRLRLHLRKPGLDALPDPAVRLDRLDHQVQLAEAAFPHLHLGDECFVRGQQIARLGTLVGIERAEHVLGSDRIRIAEPVHDPRHCSTSLRLRRSDARNRFTGMSSLIESSSRENAP